jgi:hypothetical protein
MGERKHAPITAPLERDQFASPFAQSSESAR